MGKRKFYSRILMAYIAVAILYTLVFAAYYYIQNDKNINTDISNKSQFALVLLAKNADMRFNLANEMVVRLCNDADLIAFATNIDSDRTMADNVGTALKKNAGIVTSRGLNTYVTRFLNANDFAIGKETTVNVSDLMRSLGFSDTSGGEVRQFFSQNETSNETFVRYFDNSTKNPNHLVIIERRNIAGDSPIYFVNDFDADLLFGISEQPDNALVLLDGTDIVCNISPDISQTQKAIIQMSVQDNINNYRGKGVQKEGFFFVVTRSGVYNWDYVLGVSTAELHARSSQLFLLTIAIYGLVLLISIIVMMILSKRLYRPIKQIIEFMTPYNQDHSGDEVEFIKQAVNNIGVTNQDLMDIVQSNKIPLKTKYFKDMLFGLMPNEKLAEITPQFHLDNIKPPLRVVLLEFSSYEVLQDAFSKEAIFAIKEQISMSIGEQMSQHMVHDILELDYKRFALIACELDLQSLRRAMMNVVMMVEGSFEVEITGAIGDSCEHLGDLYESYRSAATMLENRFTVGGRNAVVTAEDISLATTGSFYYPLDVERDLITHVIRLKREECHKILENILVENLDKRSLGKDRRSAFIFALTATLSRIIESMNKSTSEVFGEGNIVFLDLKLCNDANDLKIKVHQLFDSVIDYLDVENRQAEDDLSGQLLDYIHQNYNKDISLLDIGGHFNLSQCYISTLFKDITGEKFKDYLSRYRIKIAKEMLIANPNVKNKDLAQQIGCNTVATLFRLFNKYEGVSPGQFVKNSSKN